MSQTNYNEQDKTGIGLLADLTNHVIDSFTAEVAIPYGRFVIRGTDKVKQCKLPAAAADVGIKVRLGVAITTQFIEVPANSMAAPTYKINDSVNVLNWGRVWVEAETDTIDTTKDVYVRHAVAGALNKLGVFADAAGTGLAKLDNARWLTVDQLVNGRNLAMLELRL